MFGRDAILNSRYEANWEVIRERKQKRIDYNNRCENAKRIAHEYQPNDKVLIRDKAPGEVDNKFGKPEWEGPFTVVRHNKQNGTVYVWQGLIIQPYNIRKLKPYIPEHVIHVQPTLSKPYTDTILVLIKLGCTRISGCHIKAKIAGDVKPIQRH